MSRKFLIPLVAAAFLATPIVAGLSAFAQTTDNAQKSSRMGGGGGGKTNTAPSAPPSKGKSTY